MENYEQQKQINKKRAYISFLTVILGLSTPTLFSISKQAGLSVGVQAGLYLGLLISVFVCVNQKKKLSVKLNQIKSEAQVYRKSS